MHPGNTSLQSREKPAELPAESRIRSFMIMALLCQSLVKDPFLTEPARRQAAGLSREWTDFARLNSWVSDFKEPAHFDHEANQLLARMERFVWTHVNQAVPAGHARPRPTSRGKSREERRLVARAISRIDKTGRTLLLAIAVYMARARTGSARR
jgi:hypothetical protein